MGIGRARGRRAVLALLAGVLGAFSLPAVALAHQAHRSLATQVYVTVTDRSLSVSPGQLTEPGPAMVTITNRGHQLRTVTIAGPGLGGAQSQRVAPGTSSSIHLKLLAGAYAVSVKLTRADVRYLVVSSNVVGPPVSAPAPQHSPTSATASSAMDCEL